MCCQIGVTPLDIPLAVDLLTTGMFLPTTANNGLAIPHYWQRELGLDDDGRMMRVRVTLEESPTGGRMALYIEPSITAYDQHIHRRIPASCALELAARYAEKAGGTVQEMANVAGCAVDGVRVHTIAAYPSQRMDYALLCNGYQEAFLGHAGSDT